MREGDLISGEKVVTDKAPADEQVVFSGIDQLPKVNEVGEKVVITVFVNRGVEIIKVEDVKVVH